MIHWTMLLLYAVMVLWVMPVALKDGVALALLVGWALGEIVVRATNIPVPVGVYFLLDAIIICMIVPDSRPVTRAILALYPLAWAAYTFAAPLRTQWFCLWGIQLVQFILAGAQGRMGVSTNDMGGMATGQRALDRSHSPALPDHLHLAQADHHAAGPRQCREAQAVERAQ